jgi:periplasmic protein TonB
MTAAVLSNDDVYRWVFSGAVVVAVHLGLVAMLTNWHERVTGDEGTEAIVVDLAPFTGPAIESKNDLAPGPEQQQSIAAPAAQPPKPEEQPQEKLETPPIAPDADVQLPTDVKPPEKPAEESTPPASQATAPPRPRPSAAQIASWHRQIALQVERHKGYPASARAAHQTGTAELAFTLDRTGKVLASRVVRTSGVAALDQETIDTVRRAQPFPPPPSNMPGDTFDFTVPIRFNIR